MLERAMRAAHGNKAKTPELLGITRTKSYIQLRKHELEHMGV